MQSTIRAASSREAAAEIDRLERPYTPRSDFQGVSDEAELQRLIARIPGFEPVVSER